MSISELIEQYYQQIMSSVDKKKALETIISNLDNLVDADTKKHITDEDKRLILIGLGSKLFPSNTRNLQFDLILSAQSNVELADLLTTALKNLSGK